MQGRYANTACEDAQAAKKKEVKDKYQSLYGWLKPFCWIYQGFRYAKQGIKSGRNREQLKNDLKRSKERVEVLKRIGIS